MFTVSRKYMDHKVCDFFIDYLSKAVPTSFVTNNKARTVYYAIDSEDLSMRSFVCSCPSGATNKTLYYSFSYHRRPSIYSGRAILAAYLSPH